MTGPEHLRRAEGLAAKAAEYLGQGDGQATAAVWAAVAQVHATLAVAAAHNPDYEQSPVTGPGSGCWMMTERIGLRSRRKRTK
jgi:hypothetical protein